MFFPAAFVKSNGTVAGYISGRRLARRLRWNVLPSGVALQEFHGMVKKINLFTHGAQRSSQELVQKCPCIPGSNWNLEMLVFEERGKPEYPEKNLSEQSREATTNSTHI